MCYTPSNKSKYDDFEPGIYLNLCNNFKNPSLSIWVLKMRIFFKYIFWPKTNLLEQIRFGLKNVHIGQAHSKDLNSDFQILMKFDCTDSLRNMGLKTNAFSRIA